MKNKNPPEGGFLFGRKRLDDVVLAVFVLLEKLWILEIDEDGVFLHIALLHDFLDDLLLCERTIFLDDFLYDILYDT